MNLIQNQFHQSILCQTHLTHHKPYIINNLDVHARSAGVKGEKNPIKECSKLTEKVLKAAYNSKVTKLNLDDDSLHHGYYFLTFINHH